MAYAFKNEDGYSLFTAIGGYAGSSTRTELAAGILAISAHGPTNIGSDSEVFVNKAKILLQDIRSGHVCKYTGKLMSDGDLWEHFARAALAKSPDAIRLTWTKGHATDWHIQQGITSVEDKEGNDQADRVADMGVKVHGNNIYELAGC